MTREETKVKTFDVLHFVADNAGISTFEAIEKAYNMGVSEQEPVLDKLDEIITKQIDISNNQAECQTLRWVLDVMSEMNVETSQEPKTGRWIIIDDCEQFIAKCSECGRTEDSRMISKYPYCHCGAKMIEPQTASKVEK